MISDDKTGAMNLDVRAKRQSEKLTDEEQASLDEILNQSRASGSANLKQGQWYKLRVRITGDVMTASLDGKQLVRLASPGFDHPTKTKFGMSVSGSSIDFDNLTVYGTNGSRAR